MLEERFYVFVIQFRFGSCVNGSHLARVVLRSLQIGRVQSRADLERLVPRCRLAGLKRTFAVPARLYTSVRAVHVDMESPRRALRSPGKERLAQRCGAIGSGPRRRPGGRRTRPRSVFRPSGVVEEARRCPTSPSHPLLAGTPQHRSQPLPYQRDPLQATDRSRLDKRTSVVYFPFYTILEK